MIQSIVIDRIKKNALAVAKLNTIKAKLKKQAEPVTARPKLLAPKWSVAQVAFMLSCDDAEFIELTS